MTLQSYSAEMLDQRALELLDLAAILRTMAQRSREQQIHDFALHDKKVREWIINTGRWVRRAQAELEMHILETQTLRHEASSA